MKIGIIGEKGGTGKTTLAVHLAGWRTNEGKKVMLIDADSQQSATFWLQVRRDHTSQLPFIDHLSGRTLGAEVTRLTRSFDDIVVDIGAGDGLSVKSLLAVLDVAVVPLQPNEMDIWTIPLIDQLATSARAVNKGLHVTTVLNRVPTHRSQLDAEATLEVLQQCESISSPSCIIKERTSIRRSVPQGFLIDEWLPKDPNALEELNSFYRLVFDGDHQ